MFNASLTLFWFFTYKLHEWWLNRRTIFKVTSGKAKAALICIFTCSQLVEHSSCRHGSMNFSTNQLAYLFPANSNTKHTNNPLSLFLYLLPSSATPCEKLHPFSQLFHQALAASLMVDFQFSFPRTSGLHHRLLYHALKHSKYSLFLLPTTSLSVSFS